MVCCSCAAALKHSADVPSVEVTGGVTGDKERETNPAEYKAAIKPRRLPQLCAEPRSSYSLVSVKLREDVPVVSISLHPSQATRFKESSSTPIPPSVANTPVLN